jgi:hypothetical protein
MSDPIRHQHSNRADKIMRAAVEQKQDIYPFSKKMFVGVQAQHDRCIEVGDFPEDLSGEPEEWAATELVQPMSRSGR